ncbi:hypothetical protein B0T16DRAFT_462269 [Cercophora newfieldiana]|uniref:Uncharacterized protein n=1 Tax=Cercophora newfieldiana TaxID=92897 RepID=A0AA39XQR8_9PEZI|nr:hypothetical protein B0T16DRAFT_462269 [Cercophora newfieldiana]
MAPNSIKSSRASRWAFSAIARSTSPQHHEKGSDRDRPELWTPFFLRRSTLAALVLLFVLLMLSFAILFGISTRDQGLATANPNWYYLWVYGPTAAFTFIAAIWAPIEYRTKQLEPWVLMSQTFRPARDGFLLDYVDQLNILALPGSLCRRHWRAFSGIAAAFVIVIATVASSGLLVSSSVTVHRQSAPLVAQDAFSVTALPRAGARPAINTYGVMASNLSFPIGTIDQYAFQWFEPADDKTYDGLTAVVDVFEATLDCEVANVEEGGVWKEGLRANNNTLPDVPSQSPGNAVSTAQYQETRFILRTPSCPKPLYLAVVGAKTFAFNGSSCGDSGAPSRKPEVIDRFVAVWGHRNSPSEGLIADFGLACIPHYSVRKGEVSLNRDTNGEFRPTVSFPDESPGVTLDGITAWDILTEFARTTVESSDSIFMGDFGSVNGRFGTGLQPLVETAISNGYSDDRKDALSRLFGLVGAQVANQYLKEAAETPLVGETFVKEDRLVVSPVSFWILESMLAALLLITGYIIVVSSKFAMPCDTSTLAGLSTVLARSESAISSLQGAGRVSEKSLHDRLKNVQFRTNIVTEDGRNVFRIKSTVAEEVSPLLSGADLQTKEKNTPTSQSRWKTWEAFRSAAVTFFGNIRRVFYGMPLFPRRTVSTGEPEVGRYRPFTVTIFGQALLLLALPALIITLEMLYQRSSRDNGLAEIDNHSNVAHYAWTYTPTAVMVGVGLWLTAFSTTVKLLGPYSSLWKGVATAETTMAENYLHTIAILSLYDAARKRKWGIVTPGLAAMLTPFLTIVASGLLFTSPSTTTTTAGFQQTDFFNMSTVNISDGLTFANLALASNLSDPLWTYREFAIPHLAGASELTPAADDSEQDMAFTRVTLDRVPFFRSRFNCTPATRQDLECSGGDPPPTAGDKYGQASDYFTGTGYFGAMAEGRFIDTPQCPTNFVSFGHTTDNTIDEVSYLACDPYVEEVLVSATFRLPSWELDYPSSPFSPPPVTIHPDPPRVVPSINTTEFMIFSFSYLVFSNPANLDTSFEPASLFGLVVNGRNGTPIAEIAGPDNIDNLKNAVERTFSLVMAQFLNHARQNLTAAAERNTFTGIVTAPNEGRSRLHQSAISTRILEGLLGIMFVCVVLSYSTQRHMRKLLPKNPCSIGAAASMLAGSDLLKHIPPGAEWMTDEQRNELEVFREGLFGLGEWVGDTREQSEVGASETPEGSGERTRKWYGIDFEWPEEEGGGSR